MGKKFKVDDILAFEKFNKHLGKKEYQTQLICSLISSVISGKVELGNQLFNIINLIIGAELPPEQTWHILTNVPGLVEAFDKVNKDEKVSASFDEANPHQNSILLVPLLGSWKSPKFDEFAERFAQAFPEMKVMKP